MNWKNILITAALAAIFGFAGAEFGLHRETPASETVKATLDDTINRLLEKEIGLRAPQKQTVGAINERYTRQRNQLLANLYMARAQLGGAFSETMSLSGPTKEAIAQMQTTVGDLQTLTITYIVDIRNQLDPAQRRVYDQKVVEMLMRDQP